MATEYDEEEVQPPPKPKKKAIKEVEAQAATDAVLADPPPAPADPDEDDTLSSAASWSTKKLRKRLAYYTEEYQFLAPDMSSAALNRRVQLYRTLRVLQDLIDAREEIVEITVPRSPLGEPYVVGPRSFPPGVYKVRGSIASYLLWMIGESQRVELQRLQQNGRTVDLGTIGERAKQVHAAITREG